jgi:hypothetical protein
MRRRKGRPRKTGPRHRSGDLRRQAETPRTIAAGMPHRRGLGERATDQRAETELGRLVLRGTLDATLGLAGETYLALWRGYVFSLGGPSELTNASGYGFSCDGCPDRAARKHCRCEFRKRIFLEAWRVLQAEGQFLPPVVEQTVIHDWPPVAIKALRLGLMLLARHFGLTPRETVILGNAASDTVSPAP